MSTKARFYDSEKGQSLVELTLTMTVLMILLMGVVDLGRAFFTFMALRDAAQEGALYGSIHPTDHAAIETRLRNSSSHPVDLSDTEEVSVQVTILGAACNGNGIRVDVSYENFPITMPFLSAFLNREMIPIRANVTDTILRPPCD